MIGYPTKMPKRSLKKDIKGDWNKYKLEFEGKKDEIVSKNRSYNLREKLIKRILWKSKNSTTKIDINENYIQKKWKDYRNYKEGVSDINIDGISIRSATSEKHLSSDFKASNDDRQTFNKNCRKNSSRYNNFESYDIELKVGFNVFDIVFIK